MDMADVFDFYESGMPVAELADYLWREVDEVQAKIDGGRAPDHRLGPSIAMLRLRARPIGFIEPCQ
jgi:hypothetical protein